MDPQKLRMFVVAVACAAALMIATDAAACEDCRSDGQGGYICWSGVEGSGACWGGGEEECTVEGTCGEDDGGGGDPICEFWEWCHEEDEYYCWAYGWC